MYQVRVTTLEKFRRWKDNVSDYDTEDSFIESLTGKFTGNFYTTIGTAFHSIVENGEKVVTDVNGVKVVQTEDGPVYFNAEQVRVALDYKAETPQAIHELRLYKSYNTKYGKVTITGCADQIDGIILHDIKTKYSTVKQHEYMDSCQWRYYMELFELDDFVFDLFLFVGYNTDMGTNVSGLSIERYDPIPCLRYATMEEDNATLLAAFLDYVFSKNLQQYIMDNQLTVVASETIKADKLMVSEMPQITIPYDKMQQHLPAISNHTAVLQAITAVTPQNQQGVVKFLNDAKKASKEVDKEAEALCRPLKDAKKRIDEMQKEIKEYSVNLKANLTVEANRVENLILSFHAAEQERVNRERKIVSVFTAEGMAYDGVNITGHGLSYPFAELLTKTPAELNQIILQIRFAKTQSMPFDDPTPTATQAVVQPATVMPPTVKGLTTIRRYEIVDPSAIPIEYYTLDTAKITAAVKAGIEAIPGVKIFSEQQIRTTR